MRKSLILVLAVLLSGCMSSGTGRPAHPIEGEFRPLEEIRERPRLVRDLGSKTAITTVGRNCYVRDLDEWLGRVQPGTPKYRAIMRHEQEHSRRQLKTGTYLWIARYSYDQEFALLEEQIGYYYELTERRRLGDGFDPRAYALVFSKYKILTGKLISYEDALRWVQDVLGGRWTPPTQ